MPIADVRELPITAFILLLRAWREEDEEQRDAMTRAQFVATRVKDGQALEEYLKKKKNRHG